MYVIVLAGMVPQTDLRTHLQSCLGFSSITPFVDALRTNSGDPFMKSRMTFWALGRGGEGMEHCNRNPVATPRREEEENH